MGPLISLLLAVLGPSQATESCPPTPWTRELLQTGDHFRALTEMKKVEFELRAQPHRGLACSKAILSLYLKHEDLAGAESWVNGMERHYPTLLKENLPEWRVELAFLYKNYEEAVARSHGLHKLSPVVYASHRLHRTSPSQPGCDHPACRRVDGVLSDPELSRRKDPWVALAASVVPGGGQAYSGRWGAGLASFVLNTSLLALTYWAFQRSEYAAGTLAGIGAAGLYAGNFVAGWESAMRFNERQRERQEERIHDLNLGLTLPLPE